jgi:regulator of replication initiation timing
MYALMDVSLADKRRIKELETEIDQLREETGPEIKWVLEANRWHNAWLKILNERDRLRLALEDIGNIDSYKKYDQNRHVSYRDYELRKIAQDALLLDHDRVSSETEKS